MLKKLHLYLLSLLLCFSVSQQAQNTIQKRLYVSKSNNAYSHDIVETTPGNFVIIGPSIDTVGNLLQNKLSVMGVDNNGTVQWHKKYGSNKFYYTNSGAHYGMITKHNNFLYATCMAKDSNNLWMGVILKFDYNGDTILQKKIYDTNPSSVFFMNSIVPSVDNGLLLIGAIQTNTPGFNNHPIVGLYLLKTDLNGKTVWEKRIYKSDLDKTIIGSDIVQDNTSKKIVTIGYEYYDNGGYGANIIVYDSLGNKILQKDGLFDKGFVKLIKTMDGNFIAVGLADYQFQINGITTSKSLMAKFDTNATFKFIQEYDTLTTVNYISQVREDTKGNIISGGSLELSIKYTNGGNSACRIIKHDKNGIILWKKYFDNYTDNLNEDLLYGMRVTNNDQIVFTTLGTSSNTPVTFMFYRTDTTYCDVNAIGCYDYVGIEKLSVESEKWRLWPNPADDRITIEWNENLAASITLLNALGQEVYRNKLEEEKTEINISHLPKGIYFVKIESSRGSLVKKLIIQ